MITKQSTIFFTAALLLCLSFACIDDADFSVPEDLGASENAMLTAVLDSLSKGLLEEKSIKQVKELYISGNPPLKITANIVVKGYVTSTDLSGNFFKEFYMQDAPTNPEAGVKVALNLTNSSNTFNFGREVYIRLKDLYIGESVSGDGIITIGGGVQITDPNEVESISLNKLPKHILRSSKTEIITPTTQPLAALNENHIGMFVNIKNVIFPSDLAGKAFVDPSEDFDTQRKIQTCQTLGYADLLLETSSFANFSSNSLPLGGGEINAVVSKDFGGNFLVLVLNGLDDVAMNGERCTTLSETDFTMVLLKEDFETTSGDISITDWVNFREVGTKSWRSYTDTYSQSKAARLIARNSGDAKTVSWLITNGIDLENTTQEFLSFETSNSFANNSKLEALISTNWDGTKPGIAVADWAVLPAKIIANGANFKSWIHSTYINLSAYNGTVHIAFKYTGSGSFGFDGTYELDNIKIIAR